MPPICGVFSRILTSYLSCACEMAADNAPRPEPMTMRTFFRIMVGLLSGEALETFLDRRAVQQQNRPKGK
jgi:hypothetical protein